MELESTDNRGKELHDATSGQEVSERSSSIFRDVTYMPIMRSIDVLWLHDRNQNKIDLTSTFLRRSGFDMAQLSAVEYAHKYLRNKEIVENDYLSPFGLPDFIRCATNLLLGNLVFSFFFWWESVNSNNSVDFVLPPNLLSS